MKIDPASALALMAVIRADLEVVAKLLAKMFLDISPLRPAVLPSALKPFLDELRGFRHVFRHSYDYGLDPAKVAALRDRWLSAGDGVTRALRGFADQLEAAGRLD